MHSKDENSSKSKTNRSSVHHVVRAVLVMLVAAAIIFLKCQFKESNRWSTDLVQNHSLAELDQKSRAWEAF